MRRGIGLRAYSQREPLNEFKIEAYRMFDELKSTIRHDVTHTIFRVSLQQHQHDRAAADGAQRHRGPRGRRGHAAASRPAAAAGNGQGNGGAPEPARSGPKIGRNDPCWCGSGKKYKRCHGA